MTQQGQLTPTYVSHSEPAGTVGLPGSDMNRLTDLAAGNARLAMGWAVDGSGYWDEERIQAWAKLEQELRQDVLGV